MLNFHSINAMMKMMKFAGFNSPTGNDSALEITCGTMYRPSPSYANGSPRFRFLSYANGPPRFRFLSLANRECGNPETSPT